MRKETKKKMNDKGFSLVELIIVIGIMAILAGALAPQLITYLEQSRKSADVETAQGIATAVNAAMASEAAYTDAANTSLSDLYGEAEATIDNFQKAVKKIVGASSPKPKFKPNTMDDFYIEFDASKNFKIYAVDESDLTATKVPANTLYPTVGSNYVN